MQAFTVAVFALIVTAVVTAKSVPEHEHEPKHEPKHEHEHEHKYEHEHEHEHGHEHEHKHEYEHEDKEHHVVEGYYWRNFKGYIPKDALPGGLNVHGKKTYIGQVLHKDQLLPAKIDAHENKVYFESGFMEFVATKNIKILCAQYPEQFEWKTTGTKDIHEVVKKYIAVDGGYEKDDVTILIGRKQLTDELVVGKVVVSKDHSTLNITKDKVCVQHGDFEVLIYNPLIKTEKKKREGNYYGDKSILINRHGEVSYDKSESSCDQKSLVINIYNQK